MAINPPLPVPGSTGETGTWGDILNDAIDTIKDAINANTGVLEGRLSTGTLATTISAAIDDALDDFEPVVGGGTIQLLQVGDSLTENWGTSDNNIEIKTAFVAANVTNIGKGGQTSSQIAARQGGVPVLLTLAGGILPATGGVTVTCSTNLFYMNATSGTWSQTGFVAGVAGTLSLVKTSGTYVYTFTRTDAGNAIALPSPVPFLTGQTWRNRVMTIAIGRNDFTTSTPAELVERIRGVIEWNRRDPSEHIVLSIPPSNVETPGTANRIKLDAANAAIRAAFPRQWVDWVAYLCSSTTLSQAGVTPTATDTQNITDGITPETFRGDLLHFNALAYDMINNLILREFKARELVTWTEPGTVTPPEPPTLHSYGLTDASHRYVSSSLASGTIGSTVTAWDDEIGALDLTLPTSTLKLGTGPGGVDRSIDTPNVAVAANTQRLINTTGDGNVRTFAVVYNNRTPANSAQNFASANTPGFFLQRGANGVIVTGVTSGIGATGGPAQENMTISQTAGWRVAFGWIDTTNLLLGVDIDGTPVTTAYVAGTPTSTTFAIGGISAAAIDIGIAEAITWNRVLTDTERNTVRAALQAHFPVIV